MSQLPSFSHIYLPEGVSPSSFPNSLLLTPISFPLPEGVSPREHQNSTFVKPVQQTISNGEEAKRIRSKSGAGMNEIALVHIALQKIDYRKVGNVSFFYLTLVKDFRALAHLHYFGRLELYSLRPLRNSFLCALCVKPSWFFKSTI